MRHSKDWNNGYTSGVDTAQQKGKKWAHDYGSAKLDSAKRNAAAKPVMDYWQGYLKGVEVS